MATRSNLTETEQSPAASPLHAVEAPKPVRFSDARRRHQQALVLFFAAFVSLPLLGSLLGRQSGLTPEDMRSPAPAPDFSASPVSSWPGQIDSFYRDVLGFRRMFLLVDTYIRRELLEASSDKVLRGKGDWLFFREDKTIEHSLGLYPCSKAELQQMQGYLEHRTRRLGARGIKYLYVVAPDKESVYPEMLPDSLHKQRGPSRLDQLVTFLRRGSRVRILDLRKPLAAAKATAPTYFMQDTHWNGFGNYISYRETLNRLQRWFPELRPLELGADYVVEYGTWAAGERMMLGLRGSAPKEGSLILREKRTFAAQPVPVTMPFKYESAFAPLKTLNSSARGKLLITHDSFFRTGLENKARFPLAEHFREAVAVGPLTEEQLTALVEQEQPDVVVEQRVERYVR